jgi:hypothetical protein
MLSMEKIENLKKRKKDSGKIRTMTSSERTRTPIIELQSVCDFYVFVNYLFNEFFGFNLIPHKKGGLRRLEPTTSKFGYACVTTGLLTDLCSWLTF